MRNIIIALILCVFVASAMGKIYYDEKFNGDWQSRWIASNTKSDNGKLELTSEDGIKTSQDARHYQYTSSFTPFSNKGKTLVFQFESRHAQNLDCGGGYLKILPSGFDAKTFSGDTPYAVMFGPDICGGTKRTHFIVTYKGKNHLIKTDIPTETDTFSHVYTLILNPDQSFQVLIDNKESRAGNLLEAFDFLPPKEINDPEAKKPSDWVDEAKIADPKDTKPEGWDDTPAQITDPEAKKPDDWDDDLDGEWTAPLIDNPEFKGTWKPTLIDNPDYKGPWVHPKVPNPDYKEDDEIYAFDDLAAVAIEIWQVKSGTTYDNILITDDVEVAKERAETILAKQADQKAKKEKEDEEQRKKFEEERKLEEEKRKKEDAEKKDSDDNDEDNDDEDKKTEKDEL